MKARKYVIGFAVAVMVAVPLTFARAVDSTASGPPAAQQYADNLALNTKMSGIIESVNVPKQEIVIAEKSGGVSTKSLASATIVDTSRKTLAIQDLKPGDTVAVATDAGGAVTEVAVVQPAKPDQK